MCRVCVLQKGHSGDGCDLGSTLCSYDLRKGHLFVPSWARMRRVKRGSISSELVMCGGSVCFYVCCSDSVRLCGYVCCVVRL